MSDLLNQQSGAKKNPLAGWFRQPKIYVKLPSNGEFYPAGALDVSTTGEYQIGRASCRERVSDTV